jgi:hypothetical protein
MSKIEVNTVAPQCGTTLTLGESGDTVTLGSGASQSGFGRTGTVDWQTGSIKTATFTAVNGEGYFVNTTSGAFNMNLPAGSAGAIVAVKDYLNTFDSNALTIVPNGSDKIGGANGNYVVSTESLSLTLIYVDSTRGWLDIHESTQASEGAKFVTATGGTITCCGNFKVHTFTGPGTFTVSCAGNASGSNTVDYLVLAGGAGGGKNQGGGGGAGGFREARGNAPDYTASPLVSSTALPVSAQGYPIAVGGGGAGSACQGVRGADGGSSTFSTITSRGGGGGASEGVGYPGIENGNPGGSGGGGGGQGTPGSGGNGNTPPVSPPQGTNGGPNNTGGPGYGGGGGGGATAAGSPGLTSKGGNGGAGATTSINFSPVTRGGGAGGGSLAGTAPGGSGGGGTGQGCGSAGSTGTVNTGGGGGGGGGSPTEAGLAGGSGIVIIRYKFQ